MFSSTPSSTSAFGSPLLFGQTSNSNASSANPFGSQYMSAQSRSTNIFGPNSTSSGGTSMGLFGSVQATASSPVTWGFSSASMSSSTNGFGSQVGFGQSVKPNVSSTGSSGSQYTFGQSNNLFGSASNNGGTSTGVFGGSLFGHSSNLFGSASGNRGTSTGVFGGSLFGRGDNLFGSVPNNGGTSTGLFGQTASSSPIGQSNNTFGRVPTNGSTSAGVFGQTSSSSSFDRRSNIFGFVPNNGGTSTGLFGTATSMGVSGVTVPPSSSASIATSSSPTLWSSSTGSTTFSQVPASIATSSSGSGSSCMTSFGQATVPWFTSNLPGTNTFSCGTQSSFSGNQVKAFMFGISDKSSFGEKRGSRATSYTKTATKDDKGARIIFVSISAMSAYQNKSHEELRWEDHNQFNAGGGGIVPVSVQSNDFRNPFARKDSIFSSPKTPSVPANQFSTIVAPPSNGQHSFLNPEPLSVPSNPSATTVTLPSIGQYSFLNPAPPLAPSNPSATTVTLPSIGQYSVLNPAPPSVPSIPSAITVTLPSIGQYSVLNPAPPSVPSFPSATTVTFPSIGQYSILNPAPPLVQSNPSATTVTLPSIGQYSVLNPAPPSVPSFPSATTVTFPSIGQYSILNPAPPLVQSNPSATTVTLPSIGQYSVLNPAPPSVPSNPSATTLTLPSIGQSPVLNPVPPSVPSNPFSTTVTTSPLNVLPVRYGISSTPVCDKPAPARSPSLLNIRHLSYHKQRWLPIQKYKPKSDGPKVAFFNDAQKTPITPKKEAPFLPRSNPRAFISGLYEELNPKANSNDTSFKKNASVNTYENGEVELLSAPNQDVNVNPDKDGISSEKDAPEYNCNTDSVCGNLPVKKEFFSNVYELMPKVKHSDYFFEPQVEELAIKESYEPGFCSHVKGFVVGRQGYGSIKFLEDIDVRELDLESYIEFRNREVIVYMDESKKPPAGQGLNKAAEITLCNIKVVDKITGKQYVNGPKLDKFKEKLMKKTAEQGAEFVSYNPVQGEWKFRVQHF